MVMKNLFKTAMMLAVGTLSTGLLISTDTKPSAAQSCNPFGCSQPGAGSCNPFGCPNPGASPCTPFGCPPSPAGFGNKPQQTPIIVLPGNNSSSNNGMGDCMDRVMYQDFRANSEPNSRGLYNFNLPDSLTRNQIQQAGFQFSSSGFNQHKQSVVRVQVKTAEQAAPVCR